MYLIQCHFDYASLVCFNWLTEDLKSKSQVTFLQWRIPDLTLGGCLDLDNGGIIESVEG